MISCLPFSPFLLTAILANYFSISKVQQVPRGTDYSPQQNPRDLDIIYFIYSYIIVSLFLYTELATMRRATFRTESNFGIYSPHYINKQMHIVECKLSSKINKKCNRQLGISISRPIFD